MSTIRNITFRSWSSLTHIKRVFILFLLLFTFISCNKNQIFRETNNEFPMNRWLKNDVQVFQPKIIDIGVNYTVFLNFGHVYGFQFKEVPVEVLIESPSGAIERILVPLQILDKDNQDVGECLGDICDIKHPLKENFRFTEQGVYTFSVSNQFDNVFLPNVLAVGIAIEKVE